VGDVFSFLGFKVTVLRVKFLGGCVFAGFSPPEILSDIGNVLHTVGGKGSRDSFGTACPHTREL
jgi:hypothetical protein